jgi:hypothetical protein
MPSPTPFLLAVGLLSIPSIGHAAAPDGGRHGAGMRWGALGHRLVAAIAWEHLTPAARQAATALLAGEPLGEAAVWADRIRNERREGSPWHYVNIPVGARAWDSAAWCRGGNCVVGAVKRFRGVVGDPGAPGRERTEALKYLIHFVADMHQPLHVGDRGDRGGNDMKVTWRGKATNLHAVWDGDLLAAWSVSEGRYLQSLRRRIARMTPAERGQMASGSVEGWAMDGATFSRDIVYQVPAGGEIPPEYLRAAGPVLDLVLIQAGLRLARVLNEVLGR